MNSDLPLTSLLDMKYDFNKAIMKVLDPPQGIHLPSWSNFSKICGGFRPYEYTIFCGPTGCGKTSWLSNLSYQIAMQNVPQAIFSVETGKDDYIIRMVSAAIGVDLNTGDKPDDETVTVLESNLTGVLAHLKEKPVLLSAHEDRINIDSLLLELAVAIKERGTKFVIIDNLNFLLEVTTESNAVIEMDRVTHKMIMFAKSNPVHIIMVMHPRKTDGGRVLSEFDVKGSSTSVQEASNVFLFNRPDPEMIGLHVGTHQITETCRELKVAKSRKRGLAVGKSFIFSTTAGVQYAERGIISRKNVGSVVPNSRPS